MHLLKNIFSNLISNQQKCLHDKITPRSIAKFCPDCGKEIIIFWYIIRCECCSIKRQGVLSLDSVIPAEKYCSKCGTDDYKVERKEKSEFYDLHFAVLKKEEINPVKHSPSRVQVWVECENIWPMPPKLIPTLD